MVKRSDGLLEDAGQAVAAPCALCDRRRRELERGAVRLFLLVVWLSGSPTNRLFLAHALLLLVPPLSSGW